MWWYTVLTMILLFYNTTTPKKSYPYLWSQLTCDIYILLIFFYYTTTFYFFFKLFFKWRNFSRSTTRSFWGKKSTATVYLHIMAAVKNPWYSGEISKQLILVSIQDPLKFYTCIIKFLLSIFFTILSQVTVSTFFFTKFFLSKYTHLLNSITSKILLNVPSLYPENLTWTKIHLISYGDSYRENLTSFIESDFIFNIITLVLIVCNSKFQQTFYFVCLL